MKGLLDGAVKLVMLQFSFSNINAVPPGLFEKQKESVDKLMARKTSAKGRQFIGPTENVGLVQLLSDLASAGYELVDAFFQMRSSVSGSDYPVARFVFVTQDSVVEGGEFSAHKQETTEALLKMCQTAMWRVQAFLNPFFKDGEMIEGEFAISINMVGRSPLVDRNGSPILRWRKNHKGERIGEGPVPLEPELFLRIDDGEICILEQS